MTNVFILIATLYGSQFPVVQEFDNLAACNNAKSAIITQWYNSKSICVPKKIENK